jgi:predicted phage terminase large subunit-like protein
VTRRPRISEIEKELIARESVELSSNLKAFIREAWPIVEPGTSFLNGYHIDAIAEHLQACERRQIKKLIINIPPRHGKSTLSSVLYPAWLWTHTPTERLLTASYHLGLSTQDAVKTRRVIESDWYRNRWPHVVLADDQNAKTNYENTLTGRRQITSVGGPTTGLGGTHLILDDPHNVLQAESAAYREEAVSWFRESWSTRSNTADTVRIIIMQRIHQQDVSGYCISEEKDWTHLVLPLEYEGDRRSTSIGWTDPRQKEGDVLWPERFKDPKEIEALKVTMGETAVAGQLQQRPVPRGGGTFKRFWLRFWFDEDLGHPDPVMTQMPDGSWVECAQKAKPMKMDEATRVHSWDLAFKGGEKNDFVVGQAWVNGRGEDRANKYLLAQERGNYDFVATLAAINRLKGRESCTAILVEEKANGAAVINSIRNEIAGVLAIAPKMDKQSRASAVAPLFQAGNVWLPHPAQFPWVKAYIDELTMFPRGNDDQVDATTQALDYLRASRVDLVDPAALESHLRAAPFAESRSD